MRDGQQCLSLVCFGAYLLYSDLKTEVLNRCDMQGSQYIGDPEMLSYLNSSAAELHEILIQNFGDDYALSEAFFSNLAGVDLIQLPSDFYKLLAIDIQIADGYSPLRRYSLSERRRYGNVSLIPAYVYRVTYAPRYVPASALSQSLPDNFALQDWWEYIVTDVAIKVLNKQETDPSPFIEQKQALIARIASHSANRNAAEPFELSGNHHYHHNEYHRSGFAYDRAPQVRYRLAGSNIKLVPLSIWATY